MEIPMPNRYPIVAVLLVSSFVGRALRAPVAADRVGRDPHRSADRKPGGGDAARRAQRRGDQCPGGASGRMAELLAPSRSAWVFLSGDRADRRMPGGHGAVPLGARPRSAARLPAHLRGRARHRPRSSQMSCPTFESLRAEVDGELAQLEAEAVRSHLVVCYKCRARRTELLLLQGAVRNASAAPLASDGLKALGTTVTGEEPFDGMSSDATVLEPWFEGKLDYRFPVPRPPATRLLGARLCDVGGRQFPLAAYDREGRRLS